MNKRVFLVGLIGGVLASAAAIYPLYHWLPAGIGEGWPAADTQTATLWTALAATLLLLTGVVAARTSGTRNRLAAAGAGAAAGLIAALLVELFLGGASAGVWGSRLMLVHGFHATQDDAEFLYLLTQGVSATLWWVHLSIAIAAGVGLALGGLGGLAAGRGGKPAKPQPGFWLTVSATMMLTAAALFIVNIAIYGLLGPVTQRAAEKANLTLPYPAGSIFAWPVGISLAWLVLWQLVGWLIVRKAPATRRMDFAFLLLVLVVFSLILLPVSYWLMGLTGGFIGLQYGWWPFDELPTALILIALAVGLAWGATRIKFRPRSTPVRDTRLRQWGSRVNRFFQSKGEAKVAAWYFLGLDVLTITVVFFTDRAGFLLPWLDLGLALGLLFAILGILDTRKTVPTETEEGVLAPGHYFSAASLGGLFTNLFAGLTALAPLSLVLIAVVLIAPLTLRDEAAAVAAASSQTVSGIVEMNYIFPVNMTIILGITTLLFALLVSAAGTLWEKLRLRNLPPVPALKENSNEHLPEL